MKQDVLDGLKHIGIALLGAVAIYLSSLVWGGVGLFFIPAIVCGVGGWLAAGNKDPKVRRNTALGWGALGLAAGVLFYFAL